MPWVREDAPYLVNWDITGGNLRMQTMFANIGDGLLQIRTDGAGTGGATTPLNQRVFSGVDNGPSLPRLLRQKRPQLSSMRTATSTSKTFPSSSCSKL